MKQNENLLGVDNLKGMEISKGKIK